MSPEKTTSTAKEKILKTAYDLFYRQGYIATGINQIIEEARVSKATFYTHFPSKDDLCTAYLQERDRVEIQFLKNALKGIDDPYERFMAPVKGLEPWMKETDFRGCGFVNIVSEVIDNKSLIRKEARYHQEAYRAILRDMTKDLINSDEKYKDLDLDLIVDSYYLLLEGAVVASQTYNEVWPIQRAVKVIEKLIDPG